MDRAITDILLGLLANNWFYPSPPHAFSLLLRLISAPALYLFTRPLVEREVFPLFGRVIALYMVDRLRSATAALPGINRLLLLLEALSKSETCWC